MKHVAMSTIGYLYNINNTKLLADLLNYCKKHNFKFNDFIVYFINVEDTLLLDMVFDKLLEVL